MKNERRLTDKALANLHCCLTKKTVGRSFQLDLVFYAFVYITNYDIIGDGTEDLVDRRLWIVFNDSGKKRFAFKVSTELLEETECLKYITDNINHVLN